MYKLLGQQNFHGVNCILDLCVVRNEQSL